MKNLQRPMLRDFILESYKQSYEKAHPYCWILLANYFLYSIALLVLPVLAAIVFGGVPIYTYVIQHLDTFTKKDILWGIISCIPAAMAYWAVISAIHVSFLTMYLRVARKNSIDFFDSFAYGFSSGIWWKASLGYLLWLLAIIATWLPVAPFIIGFLIKKGPLVTFSASLSFMSIGFFAVTLACFCLGLTFYLMISWMFWIFYVMDEQVSIIEGFKKSTDLVQTVGFWHIASLSICSMALYTLAANIPFIGFLINTVFSIYLNIVPMAVYDAYKHSVK